MPAWRFVGVPSPSGKSFDVCSCDAVLACEALPAIAHSSNDAAADAVAALTPPLFCLLLRASSCRARTGSGRVGVGLGACGIIAAATRDASVCRSSACFR